MPRRADSFAFPGGATIMMMIGQKWLSMFILCLLQLLGTMAVNDEIRCYCNLPACVTTGYMCKSAQGACFSELSATPSDLSKARQGCVELLDRPKREVCESRIRNVKAHLGRFPLLWCCPEDMCNYVDSLDIKIHISTRRNHSSQLAGAPGIVDDGAYFFGGTQDSALRQDLWFKAAVIAVPIAGGFILIMLILLAVHMLRKDSKRHRQVLEIRRQRQFKSHLLLGDYFSDKNEANARLNPVEKPNNIYKNINITITGDEKQQRCHPAYEVQKPLNNSTFSNAMVSWAELDATKSSTAV